LLCGGRIGIALETEALQTMYCTNRRLFVATLAMVSILSLMGLSPGQEKAPPVEKPQKKENAPSDKMRGVIAKLGDPFKDGIKVQCAVGGFFYPMIPYFDKNTEITFKDGKKATAADLKPGRWISFKSAEKLEPMGIYRSRVAQVVLDAPDDGKFPHT